VNVLVCVKRVPQTGGSIVLTGDGQDIDTRYAAFTVSPHEECAVEEAVRLVEAGGGTSAVLTLGPDVAVEQLRDAMAVGIERAILMETDGREWDPVSTAAAIVSAEGAERAAGIEYDLLLFGNEAADTGGYQVPVRVATALGLPVVTGVKSLEVADGVAVAKVDAGDGWDVFEVPLPAVVSVREGLNLPRYPSVPGRLRAKKREIVRYEAAACVECAAGPGKLRLHLPREQRGSVEILGNGPEAAPAVVAVLSRLGVLS
jgi:electron transfer flavoprotein beta subunit